jgi:ferritin-like metal-binding protein YciE
MAKNLGESEIADLLKENLDQEKEMARTVESLAREIGKDVKAELREQEKAEKELAGSR